MNEELKPLVLELVSAIEESDRAALGARQAKDDAIDAKLQAASMVESAFSQCGKHMVREWWTSEMPHRLTLEMAKQLLQLKRISQSRDVYSDRRAMALIGLFPTHEVETRNPDPDGKWWLRFLDDLKSVCERAEKLRGLVEAVDDDRSEVERQLCVKPLTDAAGQLRQLAKACDTMRYGGGDE